VVVDAVRSAAEYLGIAVANMIDLFSPHLVVIGGPLAQVGDLLINGISQTAKRRALQTCLGSVRFVRSRLEADAGCIGACTLVMERYFTEVEPAMRTSV